MPICVAGMHRSGTSLVAKLLHEAGLFLGAEADILPAGPGNSEGHFENVRFIEINDAILELAGGTWDRLPTFEANWHLDSRYDVLLGQAADLIGSFADREPWGWKDPRNSLTLPFWQRVIPDVKVVICVRNPLDVAQSLQARNQFDLPTGVTLWAEYSARVMAAAAPSRRLVTHYESYFLDARGETERLLRFVGLPAHTAALDALSGVANDGLRHNRLPLRDLLDGRIQYDFVRTYLDLCAEAGPVFQHDYLANLLAAIDPSLLHGLAAGERADWILGRLAAKVIEKQWEMAKQRRDFESAATAVLAASRAEIDAEKSRADELQRQVAALREQLTWKRYRWPDRVAKWLHAIRGGKRP